MRAGCPALPLPPLVFATRPFGLLGSYLGCAKYPGLLTCKHGAAQAIWLYFQSKCFETKNNAFRAEKAGGMRCFFVQITQMVYAAEMPVLLKYVVAIYHEIRYNKTQDSDLWIFLPIPKK